MLTCISELPFPRVQLCAYYIGHALDALHVNDINYWSDMHLSR